MVGISHKKRLPKSPPLSHEKLTDRLYRQLYLKVLASMQEKDDLDDATFQSVIAEVVSDETASMKITLDEKRHLARMIFNSMRRLDILQPMMEDPMITEIMVNGPTHIFFEKNGRIYPTDLSFPDAAYLQRMMTHFFSRANRSLSEANPIADVRLPDGSRANAVLPPIAPEGPIFTIRKFTGFRPDMTELINQGFISFAAATYLEDAVRRKKTLFLCGGTGTGKTTFLNILSSYISPGERIVTIEDSAELSLQGLRNLVRLEARWPGPDGQGGIHIGQLIRTALRMRPDRIIVGEVRGDEAADMLHALHTGHPGSMCTGHGNSCKDMLARLTTMVLSGSTLPFEAVIRQIAFAIDIVVYLFRDANGQRKVGEIVEVTSDVHDDFSTICKFYYKEGTGLVCS